MLLNCFPGSRRTVFLKTLALRNAVISRNINDEPRYFTGNGDIRHEVEIGILHFGVGRFHRAHQAVYIDEILQRGDLKWGMCGVCMLPQDEGIYNALKKQNCEYNVIERDSNTTVVKKIGSIVDVIWGHKHPEDVIYALGKKSVKIVSLTVTEAGYFYHPATKSLDFANESVAHDLELYRAAIIHHCSPTVDSGTPEALQPNPKTLFGYLAIGLLHRYLDKVKPFTVMSCDNIQGNGDMTRALLLEFCHKIESAELKRPATFARFLKWLNKSVEFPNSMVDRITPAANEDEIDFIRYPIKDYEDFVPVSCELYRQWVIENKFCNIKPKFATLKNVSLVTEIKPYEKIKIRCLNGGHSALGYAGFLAGFSTIDDTANDHTFQQFLRLYLQEVSVTLDPVSDLDLPDYQESIIERFSNCNIKDNVLRICKDGSSKIPGFVLPTVVEVLQKGTSSACLSFVIASWIGFIKRQKELGHSLDDSEGEALIALVDKMSSSSSSSSSSGGGGGEGGDVVKVFLSERRLFGDVCENDLFVSQVQSWYDLITSVGAVAAMEKLLTESPAGFVPKSEDDDDDADVDVDVDADAKVDVDAKVDADADEEEEEEEEEYMEGGDVLTGITSDAPNWHDQK